MAGLVAVLTAGQAEAGCTPGPTAGSDVITCTANPPNPSAPPGSLQAGNDTIHLNSGTLNGSITGFSGMDTFNLNGAILNGTLFGGEAGAADTMLLDDTFNLTGGVINAPGSGNAVVAERGNDTINIGGTVAINGNVSGSQGADIITMTAGTVTGSIFGEGTIFFNVPVPTNDDQITIGGTAIVTGLVSGGQGNDIVTVEDGATVQGNIGQASDEEGDDLVTLLDNASVGGVVDLAGNNALVMGPGGSPTVVGAVTYGSGNDAVTIHSGAINGAGISVDLGDGSDAFIMDGGAIAGSVGQGDGDDSANISGGTIAGNFQQGSGIDDFVMTGGQIGSLNQGDGFDTFFLSDGRIVGAFEDGDSATMTGGRIGRVDMKLADNIFDMSGGAIDGNLVTGFGNDTITLSDGFIGGNISVSGGTDSVTVTGGRVVGEVRMSAGSDSFLWDGGGLIDGAILLGDGTDIAVLRNLNTGHLGNTPLVSGGPGDDSLSFDNVATDGIARFSAWESVNVTNGSVLTFDGDLVLGDSGTGTGRLDIDATSTIFAGGGNRSIMPFTAGQLASVTNAGRIDLTNGSSSAKDSLTIVGDYVGDGGGLFLDTVLGDDGSDSDKLVISGGRASGATGIGIHNLGGPGAATSSDGILVVKAKDGATTSNGAFGLGHAVAAGAHEYLLFKGGAGGSNPDNWYLRSELVAGTNEPAKPIPLPSPAKAADPPDPPPPPPPPPPGVPDPPPPPPPPEPPPEPPEEEEDVTFIPPTTLPDGVVIPDAGPPVELFRVETPVYAAVPPVAGLLALATLGTFHERMGDEGLVSAEPDGLAAWGRLFGEDREQEWSGTVDPSFSGWLGGLQAGADILVWESAAGHTDRLGFFVGYAHTDGDIRGFALGLPDMAVGDLSIDGTSGGAYWTHVGPSGWYVDAVAMGTYFDGSANSVRDIGIEVEGGGATVSLEGGVPIVLAGPVKLEPQAQIIWQTLSLNRTSDVFSTVDFNDADSWTGRIGARLETEFGVGSTILRPYLTANLWQGFGDDNEVVFAGADDVETSNDMTSLELAGGLVVEVSPALALYLGGEYSFSLASNDLSAVGGNVGLRARW